VQEILRFDYDQALQTIRQLADVRFKLLALVPFISGATIAFLSVDPEKAPPHVILAGSGAGFLITAGVLIFNLRNTQRRTPSGGGMSGQRGPDVPVDQRTLC
jgi:hypothetical protein